ncbi:hypothetical protein FNV43_RR05609 [Rhamnella rubrinervis]|uniref:Uncharacterized protein n=1 Tax=Rhamnella rubrinervis TaxID=2594499 RepID=A0A8K0HLL9_9ROSA|nr:hypothetical protein FNV43_RR05609 [Rhamnella rubrinervis]
MGFQEQKFPQIQEKFSGVLNRRSVLASGISLLSSAIGLSKSELGSSETRSSSWADSWSLSTKLKKVGFLTVKRPLSSVSYSVFCILIVGGHSIGLMRSLHGMELDGLLLSFLPSQCLKIGTSFTDNLEDEAKIEQIGPLEKVITPFGSEVIGENVEGKVVTYEYEYSRALRKNILPE